jgi:hypothetical protein
MFVRTTYSVDGAACYAGVWYWIKHVDKLHDVLVRVDDSGSEHPVSYAEQITDFTVGSERLFVISRNDKTWRATLSDMNGGNARDAWSGADQPHGAFMAGDIVYWLRLKPAAVPDAGAFPPLGPQLELISTSVANGESRVVSTILEPEGVAVIGVHQGDVWVSAHRTGVPGVDTVYRVPASGGPSERIVGETGRVSAVLTPTGVLYWTAPSTEAQNIDQVWCVRKRDASGTVETLTDWLPGRGRLFDTRIGICYIDGSALPSVWPITTHLTLPRPLPLAAGYVAVAAGENDLLLKSVRETGVDASIYRMWLR